MPRTIVFDVNETLLDLSALDPLFERLLGNVALKSEWFGQVLQSATMMSALGKYVDFGVVAHHALEMTVKRHNISLPEKAVKKILEKMRDLPPHAEVVESLQRLSSAGFRLAALTNSNKEMANSQLSNAGIIQFFKKVMSVETVRCFKPCKAVYDMAADSLAAYPDNLILVAAHEWDISGAICAGWSGAFVARPGMVLGPLSETPEIIGKNLGEVVDKIIEIETRRGDLVS